MAGCEECGARVLIPGLDVELCSHCGWYETRWGKQERRRQEARRREARSRAAAARRKAKEST